MNTFMNPDPELDKMIRHKKQEHVPFFIVRVQDMIKVSKFPVPPARSTTHTLIFLTSGVATMRIGFHPVKIRKNECLVVPAGQVFSYDRYEVNSGFICSFGTDFLSGKIINTTLLNAFEYLNIWASPVIRPDKRTAGFIANTFERIYDAYRQQHAKQQAVIQSYFLAVLCDLHAAYTPPENSKNKTAVTLANRFRELVHRHFRTKHRVTAYASLLHVSPNHLNKTVKQVTGKTVSRWIEDTIITEAKVLLFQTGDSIGDIAAGLGIYDQSYFTRLFRKHEGITPLAYRQLIEKS